MNSHESLLKKLGLGVVMLTMGLIVFTGAGMVVAAYYSPPEEELVHEISLSSMVKTDRTPNSIQEKLFPSLLQKEAKSTVRPLSHLENIDMGCVVTDRKLDSQFKSKASHIRISGRACGAQGLNMAESTIVNEANGRQAMLFSLKSGERITTDYLSLVAGENTFTLRLKDTHGREYVRKITVSSDWPKAF